MKEKYKNQYDKILMDLSIPEYYENDQRIGMGFYGERLETDEEYERRIKENNGKLQ